MIRGTFEPHPHDRALLAVEHLRLVRQRRSSHPAGKGYQPANLRDMDEVVTAWSDGNADSAVVHRFVQVELDARRRSEPY